jgi:hypothetical protein
MEGHGNSVLDARPRTWGPFTGRQLTTLLVVLIVAVVVPVGAWAVGQDVYITDPTTNAQAKVDSAGAVQSKAVLGSMAIPHTTPAWSYHSGPYNVSDEDACYPVGLEVPANKALVVTSVTVRVYVVVTPPVQVNVGVGTDESPCFVSTLVAMGTVEGPGRTTTIEFPNGLVVGPGNHVDISLQSDSDDAVGIAHVDGYWVPSAQCSVTWDYSTSPAGCLM